MKNIEKTKDKKRKIKKKDIDKTKKSQVLVVAQEIRLARLLSGNEKKTRDKVLIKLKKWLNSCFNKEYDFKEDDFTRVWKGLFYAVWMSDKPLVQEDLCESIASILDQFPPEQIKYSMLMTKAGFKVLATEWYGIDHHRMDKFLMLVRRYLRGSLRCLLRCKWSLDSCTLYTKMLSAKDGLFAVNTPHYARNATSMLMHIIDCFLEELAKVSNGAIPEDSLVTLLRPFCGYMCEGASPTLCAACRRLLTALVRQSDKGLEYQEAKRAWEQMGCPEGGPEALELVEDDDGDEEPMQNGDHASDDDDSLKALDPRAGRVDVLLPTLPVPAAQLALLLRGLLGSATSKAHRRVKICLQRFEKLARDEYPLPIEQPETNEPIVINKAKSAQELRALEKSLISSSDELALRGLSRKHRKRLLAKTRVGLSIVDDIEKIKKSPNKVSTYGDWEVESTEPKAKKAKLDNTSNKENEQKVKKLKKDRETNQQKPNGDISKKKLKKEKKLDRVMKENGIRKKESPKGNGLKEKGDKFKRQTKENAAERKMLPKEREKQVENKKNLIKEKPKDTITKYINNIIDKKISQHKINKVDNTKTSKQHLAKTNNKISKEHKSSAKSDKSPVLVVNKIKSFQKCTVKEQKRVKAFDTPKRVKFVLKNNSMQGPVDYYKSVRQSPNIPFDSSKKPVKTNLKPSTPSPINPFFKKKLKMKN
ncbi:hypothetical protein K1T71_000885 [Dendrolimus kikuchii]|uniref:Uncharacterized protein n=1 Tax=Dendrolimus kikuchii TaxID=765133 RepID=A0ACC1DG19_9NEOP|nr:hypothetical protein K1T71_000885 [Dendrolimus kikuchii]